MEQDRYQKNHTVFVVGLMSLVFSLVLLALSFYIMPSLVFGWRYNTPPFIVNIVEWLQYTYNYTPAGASRTVFLFVFLLALFFACVAYFCSNNIDNQIYKAELESKKEPTKIKKSGTKDDGVRLALKIVFFAMLIFGAAALFEWFIYTPPPAQFTISVDGGDGS